jgi:hypothetical protein
MERKFKLVVGGGSLKIFFFYMGEAYRKVDHPKRQQQHHSYNT